MKIVIAGGTGNIGSQLIRNLKKKHQIIILSRSKSKSISENVQLVNYSNNDNWHNEIEQADIIINLVGESIGDKRWTKKQKKIILDSRLESLNKISDAIESTGSSPKLIINASAVGYYSYSNEIQDESNEPGRHFLSDVCVKWENKAIQNFSSKTNRLVLLRIGVVLDAKSGILSKLSFLFKCGLGAIIGNGKQAFPWIDIDDVVGSITHIINSDIQGPVNLTAPTQDTNYSFSKEFGKVLNRPVILRVPQFWIKLMLGEMSQIAIKSLNIYPKKLIDSGYSFKFSNISESLKKNYSKD